VKALKQQGLQCQGPHIASEPGGSVLLREKLPVTLMRDCRLVMVTITLATRLKRSRYGNSTGTPSWPQAHRYTVCLRPWWSI